MSDQPYRPTPAKLIVGPVRARYANIYDAEGQHICDIRGWGRIQYFKNPEETQDKIADWVAAAINEKLEKDPI